MKSSILVSVIALTVSIGAFAEPYHDLDKAQTLKCVTESGRTHVTVDKVGAYFEVTTIQDGRRVLNDRVRTNMHIQESFPASYIYTGRTSGKTYFRAGQTMSSFEGSPDRFSAVNGTVSYVKDGLSYNTRVTCEVIE